MRGGGRVPLAAAGRRAAAAVVLLAAQPPPLTRLAVACLACRGCLLLCSEQLEYLEDKLREYRFLVPSELDNKVCVRRRRRQGGPLLLPLAVRSTDVGSIGGTADSPSPSPLHPLPPTLPRG